MLNNTCCICSPFGAMYFCPDCNNLLVVDVYESKYSFLCGMCSYMYKFDESLRKRINFKTRKEDQIFDAKDEMKFANICQKICRCGCQQVSYSQIQTRSADEPMTIFYRCTECKFTWKE